MTPQEEARDILVKYFEETIYRRNENKSEEILIHFASEIEKLIYSACNEQRKICAGYTTNDKTFGIVLSAPLPTEVDSKDFNPSVFNDDHSKVIFSVGEKERYYSAQEDKIKDPLQNKKLRELWKKSVRGYDRSQQILEWDRMQDAYLLGQQFGSHLTAERAKEIVDKKAKGHLLSRFEVKACIEESKL